MNWTNAALERLTAGTPGGYHGTKPVATEPTAIAALALQAWGRDDTAERARAWLLGIQADDGSFGVDAANRKPCWPTGWAVLALLPSPAPVSGREAGGEGSSLDKRLRAADKAVAWLLKVAGHPVQRSDEDQKVFGHDTTLTGWPWVEGTHSWVEPTAISLLALRRAGKADDARCREAVKLLFDRQLPGGGWNYGNTTVLGNTLRPHVQPTGLALWALAGENGHSAQVKPSLDYLARSLDDKTATASLCYGLVGLATQKAARADAEPWLAAAAARTLAGDASPYKLALLLLAAKHIDTLP